ncbi:MAG: LD-carboxypeptidase [Alphaproteobacteria bacterium]|nr:LD-carboxypeptidase [Alphaproteobacteria bacterium]
MKPKALQKGSRIGIVSPARFPREEWLVQGKAALEAAGYEVLIHAQNHLQDHQLAGSDEQRAAAIMDYFKDSSIDAILVARGGIGSYRVVPHLDFDVIRANPKVFCGFSDITTLINVIHSRTGLVTFHGPMLLSFFKDHDPDNITHFINFFSGAEPSEPIHYPTSQAFTAGAGEGRLVGGNLTLLQNLIGTKDDIDTNGAILYLEDDDGEKLSDIDRALWHFKNAGKFKKINGLIIGEFCGFREDSAGLWKHSIPDLLRELIPAHIPIATHFPCGHGKSIVPLPIGIRARLETTDKQVVLTCLQSPFA